MAMNFDDLSYSSPVRIVSDSNPMMSSFSSQPVTGNHMLNGSSVPNEESRGIDALGSENDLFSRETLDRDSPDLWPEQIPGVTEFVARSQSPLLSTYGATSVPTVQSLPSGRIIQSTGSTTTIALTDNYNNLFTNNTSTTSLSASGRKIDQSEWKGSSDNNLSPDEMNMMRGFGSLPPASLMDKIRELQDLAYQLGLEESREMTRGTFLNVLSGNLPRRDSISRRENIENQSVKGRHRKQRLPTDKKLFPDSEDQMQDSELSNPGPSNSGDGNCVPSHDLYTESSSPLRSLRTDPGLR